MEKKTEEIGSDENRKIGDDGGEDETGNLSDNELKKVNSEDEDPRPPDRNLSKYHRTYVPGRGIERYNNSLKNLIPVRREGNFGALADFDLYFINFRDHGTMPLDSAGLFSSLTLSWVSKFLYKARNKGLKMEELPRISSYDTCNYNADRLELLWKEELNKIGPEMASLTKVAWRFCQTRIFASCILLVFSYVCTSLTYTLFMRKLLEYLQSGNESYKEGLKWALLITVSGLARLSAMAWVWSLNHRTGLRLRSACLTLLYRKIIRCNNLGSKNIGEVINVLTNDAQTIYDVVFLAPLGIEAPILTFYLIVYVLRLFGPVALLGIIVFLLFYPFEYLISRLIGYLKTKAIKIADRRVRLMNEILDCIKAIKMYAWEKRFGKDILDVRKRERQVLLNASYSTSFNISMAPTIPVISTIVTFIAHVSAGNNLTAAQAFPYATFLNSRFRISLVLFQKSLETAVMGAVSLNRIKNFLILEDSKCSIFKPIFASQAVVISNGIFAYHNSDDNKREDSRMKNTKRVNEPTNSEEQNGTQKLNKPTEVLFDISFEAAKGKLVGICGQVGSGKSSLLLAALGQLRISEGKVMRDGSCAYVSQQAWITNATLRENILFGEEFDHSRYHKTIHACNLAEDIDTMPGGDETEIGEKGVNLSGGQKQRVALARALYADRDIYFLDDPLSAVDSRVGLHIFDHLILGALREKTVLFVTHQIQYLNRCDDIYMMHNGTIIEHGTHDELLKLGNEYALMVANVSSNNKTVNESSINRKTPALPQSVDIVTPLLKENKNSTTTPAKSNNIGKDVQTSRTPVARLTVTDNIQRGSITGHAYHTYILAAGGYLFTFIVFSTVAASVGSTALSSWWLAKWIEAGGGNTTILRNNETVRSDNVNDNPDFWYYQGIYAGTIGLILLTSAVWSFVFTRATIRASTKLHNELFKKIIASPMRFFDTTPSGRIQHLFSRDMDEVDKQLPETLANCVLTMFRIIFGMLVICLVLPWFMLPFGIIITVYYFVSKTFGVIISDLKRMDNKSRAPVISFVTATVQGLSTIHAFGKENDFTRKFTDLFDENGKYLFMFSMAMRWLVMRIDALSVAMISCTAILIVFFGDQLPPALAGLALAYTAQISGNLPFTIKLMTETEVRFTSVERMNHYLRTLKSEGSTKQTTIKPTSTWPAAAVIKFINVSMRYGDDAPVVLKNVTFSVDAGEKIGIVGRTGSGKSSLTVALFRLVELAEGKIEIDDVDIAEVSLEQLRTKLSIIPQDPVLFSGTIRSNLDPFEIYSDAEIWKALEKTELKDKVQSISGQLDASVGFGGDNLSVGERQLLCLSRALLRNSKILILDEATAGVDPETEIAVQNTVQREFPNCTILTIAHRLQTVLSLSRVLVMADGEVLEFDTPSNLLGDDSSEFSKMMAAAKKAETQ